MNFFKKNIILSPYDYANAEIKNALLTLEQFSKDEVIGTLKCSEFKKINSNMLLGIMFDNNLQKIEISPPCANEFCFSMPANFEKCEKISCVMLSKNGVKFKPLVWGSTETSKIYQTAMLNKLQEKPEEKKEINNIKNDNDEENDEEIEKMIDEEIEKDKCEKENNCDECVYKNQFYNEPNVETVAKKISKQEDKNIFEKKEGDNFFALVEGQVEELLEKYPLEDAITQIIPNSKFVRVDYNNDGTYYIFGVVYNEDSETPKYICYGLPAMFGDEAPTQIDGFYQWLPVDAENPEGEGYFIMFQNAETGENVKIEVV